MDEDINTRIFLETFAEYKEPVKWRNDVMVYAKLRITLFDLFNADIYSPLLN